MLSGSPQYKGDLSDQMGELNFETELSANCMGYPIYLFIDVLGFFRPHIRDEGYMLYMLRVRKIKQPNKISIIWQNLNILLSFVFRSVNEIF